MSRSGFWWNWWVQAAVAIGTLALAFAAVFGDWIKSRLVKLTIKIENSGGVLTRTLHPLPQMVFEGEARYYQVRVANSRFGKVHQVYLWLLFVAEMQADEFKLIWTGEVPFTWQHKDYLPGPRTLGGANADVVAITAHDKKLTFQTLVPALNLPGPYTAPCHLFLKVQARGEEGDSRLMLIEIKWDGQWHADGWGLIFKIYPYHE
jgi:hypothetical protein